MPRNNHKGDKSGRNRFGKNYYYEHDDRGQDRPQRGGGGGGGGSFMSHPHKLRVSFKTQGKQKYGRSSMLLKSLDDDVNMNGGSNNNARHIHIRGRGRGYNRGRNSPLPRDFGNDRHRSMRYSEFSWYKIIIPHGQKYTKEYLLELILKHISPIKFVPIMFKTFGDKVIFYVDDFKVAKKLEECDRRLTCSDGFKLNLQVKSETPNTDMNDALKNKVKAALAKRYIEAEKALDLSFFYQDSEIVDEFFCPLSKPTVLAAVLDIVREHVPDLRALKLDSNKILYAEKFGFINKLKDLKILHLKDNRIKDIKQLRVLKQLPLEELCLTGNPLCSKYESNKEDYIRDVRDSFPNILRLDGDVLPPPIKFDIVEKNKILPTAVMYCKDQKMFMNASTFLKEYFRVYDEDSSRQLLLNAYHEHSVFSLTTQLFQNNKYGKFYKDSRNLLKIGDSNVRRKLLYKGKLQIVAFISQFPKTQHDLDSFTMDVTPCPVIEGMMLITVTGLFKELGTSKDGKDPIRYFNRTFIIAPVGEGFCITNEQYHIMEPTLKQEKTSFNSNIQPVAAAASSSIQPQPIIATANVLSEDVKRQMTLTLSQQTNMNLNFSVQCLETWNWDFEKACAAFQEALTSGKIPPEAFVK